MTEATATVLFWCGLAGICIALGGMFIAWLFDGSASEVADQQAKSIPHRITREYINRPRMKTVRFWNL